MLLERAVLAANGVTYKVTLKGSREGDAVWAPKLPGANSQGATVAEAVVRRKSPTPEGSVRLRLHSVGTATEGSTLVRDLTRPARRAGAGRSPASAPSTAEGRAQVNPRPAP